MMRCYDAAMRTTLEIDDKLHEIARQRAFAERRSLGDVISELALKGLELQRQLGPRRPLGRFAGRIEVADDFDDTPAEVLESVERPL
jgi:hypothetical protein